MSCALETARARRLAGCFPTPLWSGVFFMLVGGAVALHLWMLVSLGILRTPFLCWTDDPYQPVPQFWHDNLAADQQIAWGVLILALLVLIHLIVAMWLWILVGIREWTTPRLAFRSRGVDALVKCDRADHWRIGLGRLFRRLTGRRG